MEAIKKKYIIDENNNKIAVQIDINTYEKLEELLENYALVQLMKEDESGNLEIREAKEFYKKLPKEK
jgi:ASC-1-like (ASCH) protein